MITPILQITEIANNQVNQYATANEAFRALESAGNAVLPVSLAAGDVELTGEEFTRNFAFVCSGHAAAASLTVPASARFFAVVNAGGGTLSVVCGAKSIDVAAGNTRLLIASGEPNGLYAAAPSIWSDGS